MHQGMLVFAQVMAHLPRSTFRRCVTAHRGDHKVQGFSCLDQFLAMAFAQLTARESLRDIEVNLRAQSARLYHMGFRCKTISRNTLSNANATRPWQMYADLAQHLIGIARPLYVEEPLAVDLDATVYAFDSTTIDLCLSVYPWAPFRSTKAAIKLHTLLDLHGAIPTFIHITDGKTHDVNILDNLIIEPGAYYLLDRGYLDFGHPGIAGQHGVRQRVGVARIAGYGRCEDDAVRPLRAAQAHCSIHRRNRAVAGSDNPDRQAPPLPRIRDCAADLGCVRDGASFGPRIPGRLRGRIDHHHVQPGLEKSPG